MLATIVSVLIVIIVLLLFLAALLIFRSTMYGRAPAPVEPVELIPVEGALVAEHLSAALRLQTVSELDRSKINLGTFDQFHAMLERMYPRLHATLKRERVSDYSLLYTWEGRASELEPVALLGHMDVVPVDPASLSEWSHPPFDGVVADGFVWGRGALDIKSTVITTMEAVEGLIRAGYQPERTLYLAFGHDEEIGGLQGARCIVSLLESRGVQLAAVLDEGGMVTQGMVPGINLPVATLGIAEKGHAAIELLVEGRPGHSSMPPKHTAIGILSRAITRIEAAPMPERMYMARLMFSELAAFMPFSLRLALANPWLFGRSIRNRLSASPQTNAIIRTTSAATVIQGGVKDNILPAQARALINCRLIPGDSSVDVTERLRKVIADEAVQVRLHEESSWEASQVSQVTSPIYQNLGMTVRQVFPEALVAPYLMAGATDSRYYTAICPNVFRFSPYKIDADLLKTVHGTNERISIENLEYMVQFYTQLIKSWTTVVGSAA